MTHGSEVIGFDFITHDSIHAEVRQFSEPVYFAFLDSIHRMMTVQLRPLTKNQKYYKNEGAIVQYDLDLDQVLWSRDINYNDALVEHYGYRMIETKKGKSVMIDLATGQNLWEVKNNIFRIFPLLDFGLGYRVKKFGTNLQDVEGINLSTGQVMWTREIDRKFGWQEIIPIDSTKILISASGLHMLDYRDGKGWSYEEKAGKDRINFWTSTNTLYNMTSNVLLDEGHIYYASSSALLKFDFDGRIQWSANLPDGITGKSLLMLVGEDIVLVNSGSANSVNKPKLEYGKPYTARYARNSGELKYLKVHESKNGWYNDVVISGELMTVAQKNGVCRIDLMTGRVISEKALEEKTFGEIQRILSLPIYIKKSEKQFEELIYADSTRYYFYTSNEWVLGLDSELTLVGKHPYESLYLLTLAYDGLHFVTKDRETFVLSDDGLIIMKLRMGPKASVIGERMYDIDKKKMYILNWKQFSG